MADSAEKPAGSRQKQAGRGTLTHIVHPFGPVYDETSRVLILGSFPSVKSREMAFFYGHPRNRFWKVASAVRGEAVPSGIEEKRAFLLRNHIALWDVIHSCDIHGSSDSSIRNAVPNDLMPILRSAPIEMIYCNGAASWNLYEKYIRPAAGIPAVRLPSTSPANAAFSLDDLIKKWRRINAPIDHPELTVRSCRLCPRDCGIDRLFHRGYCGSPAWTVAARAALHPWEEPCISGANGSGTVFFTGCTLRCCFCQNYSISQENFGKSISTGRLAEIFLELQDQGANNINLVTATQYVPQVIEALEADRGLLRIPVVWNCGGYETVETVRALAPYVDVWLPDIKYFSADLAGKYSGARDYFPRAMAAVKEMIRLSGKPEFREEVLHRESAAQGTPAGEAGAQYGNTGAQYGDAAVGAARANAPDAPQPAGYGQSLLLTRGVVIRHMVLPGQYRDSEEILRRIAAELPRGQFLISLMSQYTPFYKSSKYPEINRRITTYEYNKVLDTAIELGLDEGFMQEKSSAKEEYTPPFALQGI
jgi:putative pyruvate formate lyase activating enzyme